MLGDFQHDEPRSFPARWPRTRRQALLGAALLWFVPILVVSIPAALHPLYRSVTRDSYHFAAGKWWAHQDLYVGPSGFNYLPHFALLFSPFHFLPLSVGEVLWRWCAAALIIGGLWQISRLMFPSEPERPFFWATVLAMPLSMCALQNGNANAHFGGVLLLCVAAILAERWWLALALMALATAIKPLGLVLFMLAPLVYAPMRWRLPVVMIGMVIFPFLFANPGYVWAQHRAALTNLQACAVVTEHRFADINGIFRTFGTALPPMPSKLVRVAAGALTALLWWWGAKRLSERAPGSHARSETATDTKAGFPITPTLSRGERENPPSQPSVLLPALWFYALSASYLMLFNPMNEENSYVILSPAFGMWGTWFLLSPDARNERRLGWVIVFMALTMGLLPNALRPLFGNYYALFWHPFMTLIFVGMLTHFVWRSVPARTGELRLQPA
jgi:hypothetical protein